jgi:type IV pilus assembly protein PilX
MKLTLFKNSPPSISVREKGMVLVVAMIMVLLMTIVGLAAIRGSSLQERMAGNMRDMQLRFQAAEAGLREGESHLLDNNAAALPAFTDVVGNKGFRPNMNFIKPVSTWDEADWEAHAAVATVNVNMAEPPMYVVEELKINPLLLAQMFGSGFDQGSDMEMEMYRVSSRYGDSGSGAISVLQSIYRR